MTDTASQPETRPPSSTRGTRERLHIAGWGLSLIWVGASILMDLGWGVGLIGIATVIFLMQVARRLSGLRLEGFWVAAGSLFLLGGVGELSRIPLDPGPVLLIVAGTAVLLTAFRRRRRADEPHSSIRWCEWCRPRRARNTWHPFHRDKADPGAYREWNITM